MEEDQEYGPRVFLEYINQRLAKRQRELENVPKFSSYFNYLTTLIAELKSIRSKFLSTMRHDGLL